jgi:hypothetical protein
MSRIRIVVLVNYRNLPPPPEMGMTAVNRMTISSQLQEQQWMLLIRNDVSFSYYVDYVNLILPGLSG